MSLMDIAVQDIEADVCGGSIHALDVNVSLGHVKVVVQELACIFCLPEKIFGNISPKLYTQREVNTSDRECTQGASCWLAFFVLLITGPPLFTMADFEVLMMITMC